MLSFYTPCLIFFVCEWTSVCPVPRARCVSTFVYRVVTKGAWWTVFIVTHSSLHIALDGFLHTYNIVNVEVDMRGSLEGHYGECMCCINWTFWLKEK